MMFGSQSQQPQQPAPQSNQNVAPPSERMLSVLTLVKFPF